MVDPDKWAEGIEHSRKQTADAKRTEQEAFVLRRQIFNDESPKLWPQVRDAFEKFCESYNKHRDILYRADIGPTTFVVKRKDIPMIMIEVSLISGRRLSVISDVGKYHATYDPQVFENGHGTVAYVSDGAPVTPGEIAAAALESFVKL